MTKTMYTTAASRFKKKLNSHNDSSNNDNQNDPTSTKRRYQQYSIYRYEEVEAKWHLSPPSSSSLSSSKTAATALPANTLCWVLFSKGKGNRKQLLDRARVVGPEETAEKDPSNIDTTKNDNDNHSPSNSPSKKKQKKQTTTDDDRILVRYSKGSTYHVKRENLLPVLPASTTPLVMVIPETRLYHRWTVVHTQANDAFCEIGCDVGILVQRVWKHSERRQHVWGLDKGPEGIASAQERYPEMASQFRVWNVPLEAFAKDDDNKKEEGDTNVATETNDDVTNAADATKEDEQQTVVSSRISTTNTNSTKPPLPMDLFPNDIVNTDDKAQSINSSLVVAIDINGNRELEAVRQCLQLVIQEWKPRLIIVKSRALYADLYEGTTVPNDAPSTTVNHAAV